MNPVHSSLLVLSVTSPFFLAVAHFHGISSSPASLIIVLLLTGEKNKSTRPKYGFVELKTARTDSVPRQSCEPVLLTTPPPPKPSCGNRVRGPATSSADRKAPSTACRRKTRRLIARAVSSSVAAK